ncbi:MAG: sulfatase-like hydrolase/transferase [Roseitalea sp.]|nr:sulfatase-like hydrolase/transferase [Roseitalea sp.]MBO6720974.1 sulfatase-like hydrolase/transferase [Roseitalea sp.]MBO6743279.1 sulfatase-like hydrolase/transferase [Roseitalea sp.]
MSHKEPQESTPDLKAEAGGWVFGITLALLGFGFMLQSLFDTDIVLSGLVILALVVLVSLVGPRRRHSGRARFLPPLVLVPALLFAFWYFITIKFGQFGLGPILFHANHGVEANGVVGEFLRTSRMPLAYIAALAVGLWLVSATDHRFRRIDRLAVLPLLAFNPFTWSVAEYVGDAQAASHRIVHSQYADVADLRKAEADRPNLLILYLESSERTLMDQAAFGDVMAPLAPFAARGIELTNLHEAALTNWTLAGQVASQCGVPLMPLGLVTHNSFHFVEDAFMPGATCLADLLTRDGYETTVMQTAPLRFAGADTFAASHGWRNPLAFNELRADYPDGGNEWGLDDEDIYDAAFHEIERIAGTGSPFALSVTNIGGHTPNGYVSRSCHGRPTVDRIDDPTLKAFRCTHELAAGFMGRLEAAGHLDNTVVVIQSDHLAMRNSVYRQLKRRDRRNFLVAFGPGIEPQVVDRAATMMDVYPTILDLLGYAPPDGRAGVGVSLVSGNPTLVETHGLRALDRAIYGDTALRNRLWGIEPGA